MKKEKLSLKSLIIVILFLFLSIFLVSWDNEKYKLVKLIYGDNEISILIDKDGEINAEIIPWKDLDTLGIEEYSFYLDKEFTILYENQELEDGAALYIKKTIYKLIEEDFDMIDFKNQTYNALYDLEYGLEFSLNRKGATLECKTEVGSFDFYKEKKEISTLSNEVVYFTPNYFINDDSTDYCSLSNGFVYVDLIIKDENHIVGYGIIKIEVLKNSEEVKMIESITKSFPKLFGKYQEVSEEYVIEKINGLKVDNNLSTIAKKSFEIKDNDGFVRMNGRLSKVYFGGRPSGVTMFPLIENYVYKCNVTSGKITGKNIYSEYPDGLNNDDVALKEADDYKEFYCNSGEEILYYGSYDYVDAFENGFSRYHFTSAANYGKTYISFIIYDNHKIVGYILREMSSVNMDNQIETLLVSKGIENYRDLVVPYAYIIGEIDKLKNKEIITEYYNYVYDSNDLPK